MDLEAEIWTASSKLVILYTPYIYFWIRYQGITLITIRSILNFCIVDFAPRGAAHNEKLLWKWPIFHQFLIIIFKVKRALWSKFQKILSYPRSQSTVKIWAQSDHFGESCKQISIFTTFWEPLFQPALEPHREVSGGRFL